MNRSSCAECSGSSGSNACSPLNALSASSNETPSLRTLAAVYRELFDEDQAAGMLGWPHSGFHVHTAVWVPEDDRAFAKRLARYCARNPAALEQLTYDRAAKAVMYRSDKSEGPPPAPRPPIR